MRVSLYPVDQTIYSSNSYLDAEYLEIESSLGADEINKETSNRASPPFHRKNVSTIICMLPHEEETLQKKCLSIIKTTEDLKKILEVLKPSGSDSEKAKIFSSAEKTISLQNLQKENQPEPEACLIQTIQNNLAELSLNLKKIEKIFEDCKIACKTSEEAGREPLKERYSQCKEI